VLKRTPLCGLKSSASVVVAAAVICERERRLARNKKSLSQRKTAVAKIDERS